MIVVQQSQSLGQTEEGRLVRRLRHVEIMPVLSNGDLKGVQARHKAPYECCSARPD
jgi:hypothetical protein